MENFKVDWFNKKILISVEYFIHAGSLSFSNYTPAIVEIENLLINKRRLNLKSLKKDFKGLIEETIKQKDAQTKVSFNGQYQYN